MFDEQAQRYHVYPIHNLSDSYAESFVKARADFERHGGLWRYAGVVGNIPQSLAPPINTRGFTMTAKLELSDDGVTGPVFAYGGQLGGMGFYLKDGKPMFILNTLSGETVAVTSRDALRAGSTQITLDVAKGATATDGMTDYQVAISAGNHLLAKETIRFAIPMYFGVSEVFGVGSDEGSPVLANYPAGTPLPGRISHVVFDFTASKPAMRE
jgi:arylsulfatase